MNTSKRLRLLVSAVVGVLTAALVVVALPAGPAQAHGNVISPASRNYGCWQRWGDHFQDPAMATEDPMCYQAWQADPNAMWNWNGLFREQVAGNHQGAIPDGQLCSAGHTQSGRYNAMDTVGDWKATTVGNSFTVQVFDQALHGADYLWVYVTNPGFNPVTTALKWSDLTRVAVVGNKPAAQWTPVTGGVQLNIPVSLTGRTGRAMVYTIWQASHLDQSYYWCSDINFGGGGTTTPPTTQPTTPPTTPPTTRPTTAPTTVPTTAPTTTPPASGACSAAYALSSQWSGGYQAGVTVTAGSSAIKSWTVKLTYPSAPTIQQTWNATATVSGSVLTATNVSYNGALGAGGSTTFGFLGSGAATTPTVTCAATT
ncbi:lytic polysaccharide monooxygenase auxiliary activity family 9 protein [Paractinoplanes globisporus]|uniref:Lytic polysaccharide monooxygenase n=1 Tax=Paractinoplanes globisporus TaxID=113565 RepID=A0ABW6WMB1_9ACTN|nr:lytic polysaccharide monooxygenase [Actinoplanes globisporus]